MPCVYGICFSWDTFMRRTQQWWENNREFIEARKLMDETRGKGKVRWKVVTMVREPLARYLSACFQNLSQRFRPQSGIEGDYPEDEVLLHIQQDMARNSCVSGDAFTSYLWLISNIVNVLPLHFFRYEFNREAGYQIYSSPDVDLLVMKVERLDDIHGQAFYEFLGLRDFHLRHHNIGSTREGSGALYEKMKREVSFPEEAVNFLADSFFMRYFYLEDEIARFKDKWTRNTDPRYRLELKLGNAS